MVEEPDTATIRADWLASNVRPKVIWDLCDALDAARAELKVVKDFKDYMLAHDPGPFVTELEERAEAAEAAESRSANALAALYARAEAAEARIAAALAILHDCHVTAEDMNRVRRALAGDVG